MKLRLERGRRDDLKTLHPAYFAMVMATGIVAIAAHVHDVSAVATVLFWLNAIFLTGLVAATGMRILRHPREFAEDIQSHGRGVGFFTAAAATAVFGAQLVMQVGDARTAAVFWVAAAMLWVFVTYGVLAVLIAKPDKPDLADGLNGGWLVSVVGAQSVAILTVLILADGVLDQHVQPLMFFALVLWLGGGALYLFIMTLIFFRYTFVRMSPEDLTPPYWIDMGAMAISTLAGATLIEHAALSPVVTELAPFVKGFTLFFWAIASWWIPMLLILAMWRYLICGVPFAYSPLHWGGVFPLGMYSVATYHLAETLQIPFLMPLSNAFMLVAFVAWLATFLGLVDSRLNPRYKAPSPR
jgi:tellurite resistance protein TehA-like permease